jgi:hypothetical protein
MSIRRAIQVAISASFIALSRAGAQAPLPEEGSNLTVYVLTFGQGDDVWEKFGHNAIWIHDPQHASDITYNWGMFSFDEPQFIRRFLSGNTHYWMAGIPLDAILQEYRQRNRSILAQELNLTPAQRLDLERYLEWNALPENRFYRYDYFRDNCSTRLRDAIDRIVNGQLKRATDSIRTTSTYRSHTARLTAGNIPLYTGIMLALGHPADRRLSAWEEGFLPTRLSDRLRSAQVAGPGAAQIPLVKSERPLFNATRAPERTSPPNYLPFYIAAGLLLGVLLIYLVRTGENGSAPARFVAGAVAALWSLISGFFGLVVVAAWLLTQHVFMGRNENLLQFDPLSLALAFMIPFAVGGGWLTRGVARLATIIAMLSLLGFVLQGLPWWSQPNGEIIGLALPLNLATAWTVYRLSHYRRISRSSAADL